MPQTFVVTATLLNLRSTPAIEPGNIIGKLGEGQRIAADPTSSPAWLQVQSNGVLGFASSSFLRLDGGAPLPATPAAPGIAHLPPAVSFPASPQAALNSMASRHCPLGALMPRPRGGQTLEARVTALHQIVADLDVTRSLRYMPGTQTYCNIYAHDFCYLAGVYLPRVWWNSKALI